MFAMVRQVEKPCVKHGFVGGGRPPPVLLWFNKCKLLFKKNPACRVWRVIMVLGNLPSMLMLKMGVVKDSFGPSV
jgi:hypothetical protein